MKNYDSHGVFEEKSYPVGTLRKMSEVNIVITSDLKRAIKSGKRLNVALPIISDSLFCETDLPIPLAKWRGLKLNPNIWAIVLRMLWLSDYSNSGESLKDAKIRAKKASKFLIECAFQHVNVVLVGHGFFNKLLGKELKKSWWNGKKKTNSSHWGSATYSFKR